MRLDRVDTAPDLHHDDNVMLDELHRGPHLLDTLTGQVLEVAGLEYRNNTFLDFLAEPLLLIGRADFAQTGRRVVDGFGGFQNLLGSLLGATDHGAEFAIDLGHLLAIEARAVQYGNFALGAGDGVMNQVEFDLEFLALLNLGPIGFEQRIGGGYFP